MTEDRAEELGRRLGEVRERVAAACRAAGRDAGELTLVVITKFFPASDVRLLHGLGVRHVGENRHQEASAKAEELDDLGLSWHFIGGLQSNKAAAVATYADVVHSLDRAKLVGGLSRGATERGRDLEVLVQVRAALANDLDAPTALAAVDAWASGSLAVGGTASEAPELVARVCDTLLGVRL